MVQVVTYIRGDERPSEVLSGCQDVGRAPLDAHLVRIIYALDPALEWPTEQHAYAALTFFTNDRAWLDHPVPTGEVSLEAIRWFEGLPFPFGPRRPQVDR